MPISHSSHKTPQEHILAGAPALTAAPLLYCTDVKARVSLPLMAVNCPLCCRVMERKMGGWTPLRRKAGGEGGGFGFSLAAVIGWMGGVVRGQRGVGFCGPGSRCEVSRVVFGVRAAGGTRLVMCSGRHQKWRSGAQFPLLLPSMPCPHT